MNNTKAGIKEGWKKVTTFIVAYISCSLIASIILNTLTHLSPMGFTYLLILITGMISIALVFLFGYRFKKVRAIYTDSDPGVKNPSFLNRYKMKDAATGLLLSTGLVGMGTFTLYLTGILQWSVNSIGIVEILVPALLMIWIAFYEELVFRGFILENLLMSFKNPVAVILSAAIFSFFHAFNPGLTILAFLNIFTGGILLALIYMHNRNLWFPVCFHFGWNFIQGPVLGFQVSGIQLPSLLKTDLSGSNWLNGGDFGFEGSVIQLLAVLIGIILLSSHKQN